MTVRDLIDKNWYKVVNEGDETDRGIEKVFCCDLLSIAMGKAPSGCAWVTVMGNINTLAVATLTDAAVVILAENAQLDENAAAKAAQQGVTVLLIEQNASAALSIADRGYVLETGRMTLTGTGRELLDNPEVKRAYLGV